MLWQGAAVLVAGSLVGCGGPDGRHTVSGTVSFNGAAVPVGEVVIEPDPAAGNKGPQARAQIKAGRFCTAPRKGAIAGDVIVEVWGADGVSTRESPLGRMLFPTHRMKMHLPAEASTLDIVVPLQPAAQPSRN